MWYDGLGCDFGVKYFDVFRMCFGVVWVGGGARVGGGGEVTSRFATKMVQLWNQISNSGFYIRLPALNSNFQFRALYLPPSSEHKFPIQTSVLPPSSEFKFPIDAGFKAGRQIQNSELENWIQS